MLVHLTPQTARVIRKDGETVIPAEQVQVGDILRVLPGETVAGGRYHPFRSDFHQSGGDDGGVSAGG